MARREVSSDDVKLDGFLKFGETFPEVGSTLQGLYVEDSAGTFGQDFKFKMRDGAVRTLTVKGPLKAQLLKAKCQPGEMVTIKRGEDKGGFFTFKVMVDDGPKGKVKPAAEDEW